jgi:predicted RNase H-like HicB family nuclease
MSESAKYIKIVEWSDEDECFIGYCPGIIGPCCHGDNEIEVYRHLCEIVDELLADAQKTNKSLPYPTIGRNLEAFLTSTQQIYDSS